MAGPVRWHPPAVQPLELWDALIDGQTLWDWQRQPARLAGVLARLVEQLGRGEARFEDGRPPPRGFPRLGHVHVLGGGALALPLPERLAGLPLTVAADPLFDAAAAGAMIVPGAVVADVGQTAVKVLWGSRRGHHTRDFTALPIASEVAAPALVPFHAAVVAFVATAIRETLGGARPAAAVLALPCELDDDLNAGGCSYPIPKPDPTLAADILAEAGLDDLAALVLNDAELAAHAAALDPRVPRDRPTLVLTLGFGVGGALLHPR